jgi:hypothetical protein
MLKSGVTPQPKAEHEHQLTLTRTGLATAGFIATGFIAIFSAAGGVRRYMLRHRN